MTTEEFARLNALIQVWRQAQARAHAAEVKAVHACTRKAGTDAALSLASKAEAAFLRHAAAELLQRVYNLARALRAE